MRLKLSLARPGESDSQSILVTVDTTVTVGALADAIAARDPRRAAGSPSGGRLTLRIDGPDGRVLPADATVADAGLRSGQTVALSAGLSGKAPDGHVAATLIVASGPDQGKQFDLAGGSSQIGRGRGNDVRLSDMQVSKQHARVNVRDVVEIVDLGSSNGTLLGGDPVPRAVLRENDVVQLGDTLIRVALRSQPASSTTGVEFNRSPRLDVVFGEMTYPAPDVPRHQRPPRIPVIPLIAPVVFGMLMFAITRQLVTVLFVALSPLMMLGNVIESRVFGRRELKAAIAAFRSALGRLDAEMSEGAVVEAAARRLEHPATAQVMEAALQRSPLLWSCRADQRGFLELRLGLGTLPSRSTVELPNRGEVIPGLWEELLAVRDRHVLVEDVPVVASLTECGSLGIAGPRLAGLAFARAVVAQLVGLHSPAEVVLGSVASSSTESDWDWLKWLPHSSSDHSPIDTHHLAASPGAALRLVAEIEDVIEVRSGAGAGGDSTRLQVPAIVLLVENDSPIERSRLVDVAERGRGLGVHVVWLAPSVSSLPAACRTFVAVEPNQPEFGSVGYVDGGLRIDGVAIEQVSAEQGVEFARSLAPVVDVGARVDDSSDLPERVPLVSLIDAELLGSAESVVDRWRTSNSLPAEQAGVRRKKDNHLRASIGQAAGQGLVLDLREHGPHALVGGTTGSGKSEFLQSWVMAMALEHSPDRVTFLFVDYKGGAAFSECVDLPHSVGLVTDLSPHLVRRALTSLQAELRHREHILQRKQAKDLLELERRGDPEVPPSLVIVVDEFAALAKEVPEFVDGVVNVAQRGRSLGLHLILATQRPAGVIKDNLRANTNLRVALRMADEEDSDDVVGSPAAATFDPATPGRGIVKVGPGRLTPFQAGYVGGWTADTPPPPVIRIEELRFGGGEVWESPEDLVDESPAFGPNDLQRLVHSVQQAAASVGIEAPRRPWLDTLAPVYDLARSPQSRTDAELIYGILDDPEHQRQVPAAFEPDRDGNMIVFGTGGSGKSTALRTLAVVAGLGLRGGPCHVYGLDFGARGLQMLEPLPHVGAIIQGEDHERVQRLLRRLRQTIDERAERYARANAGTIQEYRGAASEPDEPRILVLVDGMAAFRQSYEIGLLARWFEMFQGIAADGRPVGVHLVVTADRPGAVPTAFASVVQRRLVLRLANENDYLALGVPTDVLGSTSPPGRGIIDDCEVQVTVLGGSPNTARQATAIGRLAETMASTGRAPAPAVERLPDLVRLADLPSAVDGLPTLGIADESLQPMPFAPDDVLLVVGPPKSGRTSALATLALSLGACRPGSLVYLGAGRSPLRSLVAWDEIAIGADAIGEAAVTITAQILGAGGIAGVFVEDISGFINSSAESGLLQLVKACRDSGVLFATDGETGSIASWPLQMAVKGARHGLALQPDQIDGDTVFKTPLPRVGRAEFPPGRGFYVRGGVARRVQVALPEVETP